MILKTQTKPKPKGMTMITSTLKAFKATINALRKQESANLDTTEAWAVLQKQFSSWKSEYELKTISEDDLPANNATFFIFDGIYWLPIEQGFEDKYNALKWIYQYKDNTSSKGRSRIGKWAYAQDGKPRLSIDLEKIEVADFW